MAHIIFCLVRSAIAWEQTDLATCTLLFYYVHCCKKPAVCVTHLAWYACILSTVLARACPKASFGSTTNIAQDQRSLYQSSVYLSNRDQTLTSYYIGPLNLLCEDSGMDAQTELYRPIPYLIVLVILWSHDFVMSLLFLTYWM